MPKLADRVHEISPTVGLGPFSLSGAAFGRVSFGSSFGDGDSVPYVAEDHAGGWECGLGTYNAGPNTLSRTVVFKSSNAGALVSFGPGPKDVFCDLPAEYLPFPGAFDVRRPPYNCKGDGIADDWAGAQQALNDAGAISGGAWVDFSGGAIYNLSRPLVIGYSAVKLKGPCTLRATHCGPVLAVLPASGMATPTGAALATGAGGSLQLQSAQPYYWLQLKEMPSSDINGLAQFCAEMYVKLSVVPTDNRYIISSQGQRSASEAVATAMTVFFSASFGTFAVALNVAGTVVNLHALAAPLANTVYHLALTYDGTTVRFFINGALQSSQSASGTVRQSQYENWQIGAGGSNFPDGAIINSAMDGLVDSVRISNTARYTANFTNPTAKFVADNNALILINFDDVQGKLVGCQDKQGTKGFLSLRTTAFEIISDIVLRGLELTPSFGTGLYAQGAVNLDCDRLKVNFCRVGVYLNNNSYKTHFGTVRIISIGSPFQGWVGFGASGACYFVQVDYADIEWAGGSAIVSQGSDLLMGGGDISGSYKTGLLVKGTSAVINGLSLNTENAQSPADDLVCLSRCIGAQLNGVEFQALQGENPLRVDGGDGLVLVSPKFSVTTPQAQLITFNANPTTPIRFIAGIQFNSPAVPVTDNAHLAQVTVL